MRHGRMKPAGKLSGAAWRWIGLALIVLATCWGIPARAETINVKPALCHAVTDREQRDDTLSSLRFSCTGTPQDYQQRSLWLTIPTARLPADRRDLALMVHQSRFDRLAVAFSYADGAVKWQEVRGGQFGAHWRAAGQIVFEAPDRDAPLTGVTMRFDHFAGYGLLHARLMSKAASTAQSTALAAVAAAALTLLLIGSIYTFSLALAVRRQYLAWHGAWAACMFLWGLIWSQLHLLVIPAMAGRASAQTGTFLSCLAITLGTASALTAPRPGAVPRWAKVGTLALGVTILLLGIPLTFMRGAGLMELDAILGFLILADLLAVALCLACAWRRGEAKARDFAGAWFVPMATLAFIQLVDVDDGFWNGGSKLLILLATTWQTLWLSGAATRRLGRLRIERDRARAAEIQARELARRDALTGLRNRRGLIESAARLLEHARANQLPAAFLLVDIDRFKAINDVHGHDAGDAVLRQVGRRIAAWEGTMCTVGRIGGEEFGLLTIGLEGVVLRRFAESVRLGIAACDHGEAIGAQSVTASIGVAEAVRATEFQRLFRRADEALYDAKRAGRDRVVSRRVEAGGGQPRGRAGRPASRSGG
ncbi:GGDEF domain-containing protein [uncultured Sphingomonas sp.]|uniref:GGDEF domain-containing protein n=1 Tax=uncultured Sphingomonas sp. TaxID=158754 RepID=UPI002614C8C7|nr:GGDEF domain-containing protein [uncultured Sphingomonas sp.]